MKGINKIIIFFFVMIVFSMDLFSCKMVSLVSYESEEFEKFKNKPLSESELPNDIYFTRIMTTVWVDLIFRKFSKSGDFDEMEVKNISIEDDRGRVIEEFQDSVLKSNGVNNELNGCNYQLYSYRIDNEELRLRLEKYKTKYIMFYYEINGQKYSERLNRTVEKYPLLRT